MLIQHLTAEDSGIITMEHITKGDREGVSKGWKGLLTIRFWEYYELIYTG